MATIAPVSLSAIFFQNQPAAPSGPASLLANPIFFILPIFILMYFLMIRPAQTQRKRLNEMIKSLKVGDKVITNGGIYGTIAGLEDDAVQLRIAEQVKIKVARNAIAGLQTEQQKES
jgi:preprotein translocase subunit YajC